MRHGTSHRRRGTTALLVVALLVSGSAWAQAGAFFDYAPPEEAAPGVALVIEGRLRGKQSFRRLVVRARGMGQDYEDFALTRQYGDVYRATLPPSRMSSPGVELFVEGVPFAGPRQALLGTAAAPVRVNVSGDGAWGSAAAPRPAPCADPQRCIDSEFEGRAEGEGASLGAGDADAAPRPVRPDGRAGPWAGEAPPTAGRSGRSELEEELAVYAAEASTGLRAGPESASDAAAASPTAPRVLRRDELEALGARTVHDALQTLAGLSVSRDVQGFWRLAVRGIRSAPDVAFFLDDLPLDSFFDGQALANLPLETVERIEVSRSPTSMSPGQGGGFAEVRIYSRRDLGVRVSGVVGTEDDYEGHLSAARELGPVRVAMTADFASQLGVSRPVARDGFDSSTSQRPGKVTRDEGQLVNLGGSASASLEGLGAFELSARWLGERRSALFGAFDVVGPDSKLRWDVFQGQLRWSRPLANGHSLSARLAVDRQVTGRRWQLTPRGYQVRPADPATLFPEGILEWSAAASHGVGLAFDARLALPAENRLEAGLEAELRALVDYALLTNQAVGSAAYLGTSLTRPDGIVYPTELGNGGRGPAADRFRLGLHARDTWTPFRALSVEAGLRGDFLTLPVVGSDGAWQATALVPLVAPHVAVRVSPLAELSATLRYGRRARAPTVQELAEQLPATDVYQGRFVGNRALSIATLDALEARVEHRRGLAESSLFVAASFFFHRFNEPIVLLDTTGNLAPYRNRPDGVQALGAEGEARIELDRRTRAWANVSWVRAEDLGTPPSARLLTDVPQARFNAGFTVPFGRFASFDAVASFASERRNPSRSVLELIRRYSLPGYTTVAAQLRSERLLGFLELALLAQNAFSCEYADDVPRPDRVPGGLPRETLRLFAMVRVTL